MENSNDIPSCYVVKRYKNRKLYNTKTAKYMTQGELIDIAAVTPELIIVDNVTKEDITGEVLATALASDFRFANRITRAYLDGRLQ